MLLEDIPTMVLPAINIIAALALFSAPRNMPPLGDEATDQMQHIASTSDYGARKNHPTAYDDNPPFKGPLRLEQKKTPDLHRRRIRGYYLDDENLGSSLHPPADTPKKLGPSTPTGIILKSVVDHLARRNAPVDAKEVSESIEFYLRCGKRLFGAARRVLQNENKSEDDDHGAGAGTITIHDLCSGHGLTGMLFLACNPPGRIPDTTVRAILVDQFQPKSHLILRDCISEICPWVSEATVSFESSTLEDYASRVGNERSRREGDGCRDNGDASIVISTHACGSLTDMVLEHAMEVDASSLAVMPCCYTGTDSGVPYGVRRVLGVGLSADVRRSFYLQGRDYHVDFAAIPQAITPMNRIIVAERRR